LRTCSFSWSSKKHEITAQSTTEADYITAAYVMKVIWLRNMLEDLGCKQTEVTKIMCDDNSAISI